MKRIRIALTYMALFTLLPERSPACESITPRRRKVFF